MSSEGRFTPRYGEMYPAARMLFMCIAQSRKSLCLYGHILQGLPFGLVVGPPFSDGSFDRGLLAFCGLPR